MGRWPSGRVQLQNPEVRGLIPRSAATGRRSSALSTLNLLRSTPSSVLCLASNHGIAYALRLRPTRPVTDFWG